MGYGFIYGSDPFQYFPPPLLKLTTTILQMHQLSCNADLISTIKILVWMLKTFKLFLHTIVQEGRETTITSLAVRFIC